MKVVAFNGSPRTEGNTYHMIKALFAGLEKEGVETELVQVGGKPIRGCVACGKCRENKDGKCVIKGDVLNECVAKMAAADGIVIGSPTYFSDVTAEIKALIDRAGFVSRGNNFMLRRKLGAAVCVARRAGATRVFNSINHFFLISQMIIPGSNYWNMGMGLGPGDVLEDEEGIETMRVLAENMAWLLKRLRD